MRYIVFGGLFAFGFATVFLGIMLRLGKFRWAYAGQSILVYAQREIINVSIPGGLNFVVIALMVIRPDLKDWLTYPLAFFFFTTLILAVWQPWWLKPAWLRWLEGNYRNVLEEMLAEARAMGRRNWAEEVKTQEGLERWADSVAQKHGWQRRA